MRILTIVPDDLLPFAVTARVALAATALVTLLGLPLARGLSLWARHGTGARRAVAVLDTLFLLPLVLPPTTLGYFLLVLLGRRSPLGAFLTDLGIPLVFTAAGAVVASAVSAFPLFYEPVKAAFDSIDTSVEDAARLLGAPERFVLFRISLPLASRGLLAGIALAFARAVGDFGTTLMVAGSIPGHTQTVALAIYEAVQAGEDRRALMLAASVAVFSLAALAGARLVRLRGAGGAR